MTVLPHITPLYQSYLSARQTTDARLADWYGPGLNGGPFSGAWMGDAAPGADRGRLAEALHAQAIRWQASGATLHNIEKLRQGARAVVTGQQVGLLGGPLLVLHKAATAVARAKEATARTGVDHVPVFWLATEDHDLAEVDLVSFPSKTKIETMSAGLRSSGGPVGAVRLGQAVEPVLGWMEQLLGETPETETLRAWYGGGTREQGATLADAFAGALSAFFAGTGLVVVDASTRIFHELGVETLRKAIEHAEDLESELLRRGQELESAGLHAQVKVAADMSLLFLISGGPQGPVRQSLRRTAGGEWKAGRQIFSTAELLAILEATPERISPNALLRPVFQDTIFPTAAYIGGPAEIAYWAQSSVVYRALLGRITPVLPRISATLLEPAVAQVMDRHEIELPDAMTGAEDLALRLGARAMPIALKRKLSEVGNTLDEELNALLAYVSAMDESLGRTAQTSGSKMRYQMNRLRRITARHEMEREASLLKHATAVTLQVFPDGKPQERVIAGAYFLARSEGLVERLITEAEGMCGGHAVVRL